MNELQTNDFTIAVNGDAFISQRKCAELCGVARNSVVHFFKDKCDITQGVRSDWFAFVVQHYSQQQKVEAVNTLISFSTAGAKAYIYHEAGFKLKAEKPLVQEIAQTPQVEDYIKGADLLAGIFKVEGAEKIKMFDTMLSPFPSAQRALPSYNSNIHVGTIGQVNERVAHAHAYSFHKKENEIPLSAQLFNKLLVIEGFLSEEITSSGRKFKSVTEKGLEFGKNVVAKQSIASTQPHWYDDNIMELYEIINPIEDENVIG